MTPQAFRWENGAFVPLRPRTAERELTEGRVYWLTELKETEPSGRSWRHMMACLKKAWENLPDEYGDLYPSPTALRKRALIQAGFYDEVVIEHAGGAATAGMLATAFKRQNEFSHVIARDGCIIQRTAKSQRQMDRETFNRSKTAIFEIVSDMSGIDIATFGKEA